MRFVARCMTKGCPWYVRTKRLCDGKTIEIPILNTEHTCLGVNKCKNYQATASWVAKNIMGDVKANPNMKIMNQIEQRFHYPSNITWLVVGRKRVKRLYLVM